MAGKLVTAWPLRVDWGTAAQGQTELPANAFGGDTVLVFAGFAAAPAGRPIRLLATDAVGQPAELARGEAATALPQDSLARIAASRRLMQLTEDRRQDFAVRYQLMSRHTNCLLVHRRADADKITQVPTLHRLPSMLAAGWGATSVHLSIVAPLRRATAGQPQVLYSKRSDSTHRALDALIGGFDTVEEPLPAATPLQGLADAVVDHLSHGGLLVGLPAHCSAYRLHERVELARTRAIDAGLEESQFWLLLARWVNEREDGSHAAWVEELLAPFLQEQPAGALSVAQKIFDEMLGRSSLSGWRASRQDHGAMRDGLAISFDHEGIKTWPR